jgi:hypothetical protein
MANNAAPRPGVREAHLLRKRNNPLFEVAAREVTNEALADARLKDGMEMDQFMQDFQALVQRAVTLEPDASSESVLELKEALDRCYQQACGLPGDQTQVKQAIRKLVEVIMHAVRSGIGNDAYAARQLDEEDLARQTHFELQELPLVAALTHADSPVGENELVPSLLSEADSSLERCLMLFDDNQLAAICHDAEQLLDRIDPDKQIIDAWRRLDIIRDYYHDIIRELNSN